MTPLSSADGALSPSAALDRRDALRPMPADPAVPSPFSGHALLSLQIDSRRARLAALEVEIIAACEAAALGVRAGTKAVRERDRWTRTTWHRYLAAAMRLEATHGPRLRRLHQEIGQLERPQDLLVHA